MKYVIVSIFILLVFVAFPMTVYGQKPELATYRETAHVLVDDVSQNQTSAFITLSTVSNLEMQVPTDVDGSIHNAQNVTSVSITNAPNCAFAATTHFSNGTAITPTQSCVIITILDQSLIQTHDLPKIQNQSQALADTMIDKINKAFSINAQRWQVFVRPVPQRELTAVPVTGGSPSANASINVVYTFPYAKTSYLFDSLSSVLIPNQIRSAGGFYDAARQMSEYSDSSMTFEILPQQNNTSLYQLQVARYYPMSHGTITIKPLQLLGINQLVRSSYFNVGFFPLNSLLEVSALSKNNIAITSHGGDTLPTTIKNGQRVPTDLTKAGWVFDPDSGKQIFAVYLFGKTTSTTDDDLTLTISPSNATSPENKTNNDNNPPTTDYSVYIIIGIVAAGAGAVYLFTRRR